MQMKTTRRHKLHPLKYLKLEMFLINIFNTKYWGSHKTVWICILLVGTGNGIIILEYILISLWGNAHITQYDIWLFIIILKNKRKTAEGAIFYYSDNRFFYNLKNTSSYIWIRTIKDWGVCPAWNACCLVSDCAITKCYIASPFNTLPLLDP